MISVWWEAMLWLLVGAAGLGALAGLSFYRRGAALQPGGARLSGVERHQAAALAARPTWLFDFGMATGLGLMAAHTLVRTEVPLLAAGLLLVLLSATGKLLVLGGRRRLRSFEDEPPSE